jgi:hypothetical protein
MNKKVQILIIEDYIKGIPEEEIKRAIERVRADVIVISKLHIPSWSEEDSEQLTGIYVIEENNNLI